MFTANQLVAHVVGDYVLQSEWMACNKSKSSVVAAVHSVVYALPFLWLTQSPLSLFLIVVTHFFIDRYRLARYVIWLKNRPWPGGLPWSRLTATGFPEDTPPWMAGWLFIIVDNTLHIILNALAIRFFG